MNQSDDFRRTVRKGVRAGRRTLVVHAATMDVRTMDEAPTAPQVGFVVSKAVGNAVTRNRVKRVLRHCVRGHLAATPAGTSLVVRALPPAAVAPDLAADLDSAWRQGLRRLAENRRSGEQLVAPGSMGT